MLALDSRPVIRDDGYLVFTPPESSYDLRKARVSLYGSPDPPEKPKPIAMAVAPARTSESLSFPALDSLETVLSAFPPSTQVVFVGAPVHITAQPAAGTIEAYRESACKLRASRILDARAGLFVDFRLHSQITENDENYWDPLHYRLPVAQKLVSAIGTALRTRADDPSGFWRIIPN